MALQYLAVLHRAIMRTLLRKPTPLAPEAMGTTLAKAILGARGL